jgi:hypothetical protein
LREWESNNSTDVYTAYVFSADVHAYHNDTTDLYTVYHNVHASPNVYVTHNNVYAVCSLSCWGTSTHDNNLYDSARLHPDHGTGVGDDIRKCPRY